MDFVEKIFKQFWKTEKQKRESSSTCVYYEKHELFFESLLRLSLGKKHGVLVRPVDSLSGCSKNVIYLPSAIDICSTYEENLKIFIYSIVKTSAAFTLYSKLSVIYHDSLRAQVLETFKILNEINSSIDSLFPEFRFLENSVEQQLDEVVKDKSELYMLWKECRSIRTALNLDIVDRIENEILKQKRNDELSSYLYSTIPLFLKEDSFADVDHSKNPSKEKNDGAELKKKRNKVRPVKNTRLNDKEVNPVIHSFEKLETLDKYEGGRRFDSGDDELSKHESALDEVDLSQVTTDGESSSSTYSVDDYGFRSVYEQKTTTIDINPKVVLFDEWDYRTGVYKPKFCTVNVKKNTTNFPINSIDKKYSHYIEKNRKKIIFFKNNPLWINRMRDGDDIDTSQWARTLADHRAGYMPVYDVFMKKVNKDRDVSILFLFDQSLSTDSWIDNQKIINIVKDSIWIAGESLKGVISDVYVASTFSVSRKNCVFNAHKNWVQDWVESYGSIFAVEPTGYTRLGPGVRCAIEELKKRKSKKKILFIITDGKVSDIDPYEGRYGLYDVKKALSEAESLNIKTIGITLDKEIKSYFRIMFGKYKNMKSANDFSDILIQSVYSVLR